MKPFSAKEYPGYGELLLIWKVNMVDEKFFWDSEINEQEYSARKAVLGKK